MTIEMLPSLSDVSGCQVFNLNDIGYNLKAFFENARGSNRIDFNYYPGLSDDLAFVMVDEILLQRVLSSLLINAFNVTQSGFIHFGYSLERGFIQFYVKNSGLAIPEKLLDSIFESLSSTDGSTDSSSLGLTICRHYVQSMGGSIWVKSCVDTGTTFYFSIPKVGL